MKNFAFAVVIGCIASICYISSMANRENLKFSPISFINTTTNFRPRPSYSTNQDQSQTSNIGDVRSGSINGKSDDDSSSTDISAILNNFPNLKLMHDKLITQGRDEKWATSSEHTILESFHDIPDATDIKQKITVRCGITLCEVIGELDDPVYGYDRALNAGMSDTEFTAKMWANGYRNMGSGRGPGSDGRPTFVVYYQREVPVHIKPQKRVSIGDDPIGTRPQ